MARLFSNLTAVRHGWKGGGLYVIVAVVLFAVVVFLLFRGHSSGPQEAAADVARPRRQWLPSRLRWFRCRSRWSIHADPQPAPRRRFRRPLQAQIAAHRLVAQPVVAAGSERRIPRPRRPSRKPCRRSRSQPATVIEVRNKLNKVLPCR